MCGGVQFPLAPLCPSASPPLCPPAFLSPPCRVVLTQLEDRARPHPYAEIRKVLEAELGGAENVDALFEEFEETATAAASLAQVGGGVG